ncbi:MAG TPA: acyltransferase [Streptosporangiaceae bacterium]|nr:acyltransferase [Streptosporangiaceae bacterium]
MASFRRWRRLAAHRVAHRAWHWLQLSGTITADTAAGRRFAAFGPGSLIAFPTGAIYGEQWIVVGDGTMIGEQASVCAGMAPGHDLGPEPVLRIGDRCVIGRGSHIVAHKSIEIGDDVYTGPYVYITDQNHSYADPDVPIGRQWPVNSPVRIGPGTWLGTGVIILPGSEIGRNVVVAAGSVVRGRIGDHCVVAGAPARVVRSFRPETGWARSDVASAMAGSSPPRPDPVGSPLDLTVARSGSADPLPGDPGLTAAVAAVPPVADHAAADRAVAAYAAVDHAAADRAVAGSAADRAAADHAAAVHPAAEPARVDPAP